MSLLLSRGIRSSTARTYSAAQRIFFTFLNVYGVAYSLPCDEDTILLYVAYLDRRGIKGRSVRVYLAALRSLHIDAGYSVPALDTPRLKRILRSLDITNPPPRQKLPITLDILQCLFNVVPPDYEGCVMRAAMACAFFGCLRASELCVVGSTFDPLRHLTLADVQLFSCGLIKLVIKRSKTDTLSQGFSVFLRCTSDSVCAHCALLSMHRARHQSGLTVAPQSPLFLLRPATHLSKYNFVTKTRHYLRLANFDPDGYSGHSYRAGCATSAALAGFSDWELQLLGRWSSSAYLRYIRAPASLLASFSQRLSSPHPPVPHPAYTSNLFHSG